MIKPTLVVLAAGMGSRYGKLKQMDGFGPNGETIIDYSIHDAIEAGFGKVVFIIREYFKEAFQTSMDSKFAGKIDLVYVTQELNNIPSGFQLNPEREKPWGTAHAVWVAKDVVNEPFAVINADDFYGTESYKVLHDYLANDTSENYAVVAYHLKNTLSDHGTVNRGVCYSDENNHLTKVVECTKIQREADGIVRFPNENGGKDELKDNTLVSMNMWAFKPSYFEHVNEQFEEFLKTAGHELKSEFYIPSAVDKLIGDKVLNVDVLDTDSSWFGVTYQEDKPIVIEKLNALISAGAYPQKLF
ncbi:MAG: sugar phosphate nucleotidyltransferase [Saprospiraceae bacterium]|nr:sugar phosphate nucleotidyltransferase [Saprospiraceae bacterium]